MSENNTSPDEVIAVATAIMNSVNWKRVEQAGFAEILKACHDGRMKYFLTEFFVNTGWVQERRLQDLGYPSWANYRLTPGIDDSEPFTDPKIITLKTIQETLPPDFNSEPLIASVYAEICSKKSLLWSSVGLKTLEYFAKNPPEDFVGKRVFAWKSAVRHKVTGGCFVPFCHFKTHLSEDIIQWESLLTTIKISEFHNLHLHC